MKIVRRGDPGYDQDRQIQNARFNYYPLAIYYCGHIDDVKQAIRDANRDGVLVRIRSGGHQHEGMCSGDGVYLIDVTGIHDYSYTRSPGYVWIGAGASLADIYVELWKNKLLFPGGLCGGVHVGGLAQGGGWGGVARMFGLTCDSLVAVDIVKADGESQTVFEGGSSEDRELLRALRGAGGGNFGVVTHFCFSLHQWPDAYTDLTLQWWDEDLKGRLYDLMMRWVEDFPGDADPRLTTFLRLLVVGPGDSRALIGGRYLGTDVATKAKMDKMLSGLPPPKDPDYKQTLSHEETIAAGIEIDDAHLTRLRATLSTLPGYQPGPALADDVPAAAAAPPDLTNTCAQIPLRHKISSGFLIDGFDASTVVKLLIKYIEGSPFAKDARQYVSLHCLGGAIDKPQMNSCYGFRGRRILLQYQAWWLPDRPDLDATCIPWIEKFRRVMESYTDGAFINFVDRDIPLDHYYGGAKDEKENMNRLKAVKRRIDPTNFFCFGMGIRP
jgi:FAD/FMN-containing dehydrogenase